MITLKHLNKFQEVVVYECKTINEAISYEYISWYCLGELCSYYYNEYKLDIDIMNQTEEEIVSSYKRQIDSIDSIFCFADWD